MNPKTYSGAASCAEDISQHKVFVSQCLSDKPKHSGTRSGWIIEGATYNPEKREKCNAVGKAVDVGYGNGIVYVFFLGLTNPQEGPDSVLSIFQIQTAVFAHVDDIEVTDREYSFPDNDGLEIVC